MQHCTNNAAFSLDPGTTPGSILLDITSGSSAGATTAPLDTFSTRSAMSPAFFLPMTFSICAGERNDG